MLNYFQVEGNSSLVRDARTGAILNVNNFDYQEHKKLLMKTMDEKAELNSLKTEIEQLRGLVMALLEKNKEI